MIESLGMFNRLQEYFDTADPRVAELTKKFINRAIESDSVQWIGAVEETNVLKKSVLTFHLLRNDISTPQTPHQVVQTGNYMEALEGIRDELRGLIEIKLQNHDASQLQVDEITHHIQAQKDEVPDMKVVFEGKLSTSVK